MSKLLIVNILTIIITSIVTYFIYIWVLNIIDATVLKREIQLAYLINTILAIIILVGMFFLRKRYKDQLVYIFVIGGFIKFGLFFIFFFPTYNLDGNISRNEFLSFFIPYMICLSTETLASTRLLNKLDTNN